MEKDKYPSEGKTKRKQFRKGGSKKWLRTRHRIKKRILG